MLKLSDKSRKITSIVLIVLTYIILNVIFKNLIKINTNTKPIIWYGLAAMLISYILYCYIDKKIISLFSLFLLSFIVFQFGEPIAYVLNLSVKFRLFNFTNLRTTNETIVYTVNATLMLIIGSAIFKKTSLQSKESFVNEKRENINGTGKQIFVLLYALFLAISLYSFYLSLSKGYLYKREFEDSIPMIIMFLEPFLIALSIMTILTEETKDQKKKITIMMIIYSLIVAANGDRTQGISGILIFGVIWFFIIKDDVKNNKIELVKIILSGIGVLILISSIMYFRTIEYRDDFKFSIKLIFEPIFEMGYNFNSLSMTKKVMGKFPVYRNGSTYINGIFASFPDSLDIFGIFLSFREGLFLDEWLTNAMGYDFGTGYSLVAESYLNFAENGIFVFIFIGALITPVLQSNYSDETNLFNNYKSLMFLYLIFTAPRRQFYNISSGLLYTLVIFPIMFKIISKIKHTKFILKKENVDKIEEIIGENHE